MFKLESIKLYKCLCDKLLGKNIEFLYLIIFFSSDLNVYDTAHWRYYGIFGFGFQNGFGCFLYEMC